MSNEEPPKVAGGLGALWATSKHLQENHTLARGTRALLAMNQQQGFDCPGCAWPEPAKRDTFEFCENGAKAIAEEATTVRLTPEVFATLSIDDLRMLSDFELGHLGRITEPMVLDGNYYRPITWDAAIELLAGSLKQAGHERSVFYTSGRTSNEAAFLYQLVGRMFGTNNFPDCSNMCHESSGVALSDAIGIGKGTVGIEDFEHADLVFIIGQNPGTNHPRMMTTLRAAAKRGCTIVAVNPLKEVALTKFAHPQHPLDLFGGVAIAKEYVQVQIGGDQQFFLGIAKAVLEKDEAAARGGDATTVAQTFSNVVDSMFIGQFTDNYAAYRAWVLAMPWQTIVDGSGISEARIREIAELYLASKATIFCWAMGLTQHKNSVATIQEVCNVALLRGNIGRPGAGLCPVRGHSNVQGDRTMGIYHLPRPAFLDALGKEFGFTAPTKPGVDAVETCEMLEHGQVGVFVGLGGNFLMATPDTPRTAAGLGRCDLTVGITTKLNRTHLYPGKQALLLPCLGRSEKDPAGFVTVEDSMSMVHSSTGVLEPASDQLRSEPWICAQLGKHLIGGAIDWDGMGANYDRVRDHIAHVMPHEFSDFNERVRTPNGFQLPNNGRDRTFNKGRARFNVEEPPDLTIPPGKLRMMTVRSHDQYNTTIYGMDDRYRGVRGERRVVFVNPVDMVELGFTERETVDLVSHWHDGERVAEQFVVIPYDLPRGNCCTYFPETNVLVPLDSYADRSRTPTSKSVIISIRARTRTHTNA
ncbi:MAG: FdhF/YdeP family oxidoreductase [Kofleriaceae bacterium]